MFFMALSVLLLSCEALSYKTFKKYAANVFQILWNSSSIRFWAPKAIFLDVKKIKRICVWQTEQNMPSPNCFFWQKGQMDEAGK